MPKAAINKKQQYSPLYQIYSLRDPGITALSKPTIAPTNAFTKISKPN